MLHRPGDSIRSPYHNDIELAVAGVGHHLIETRPPGRGAGDPVRVFVDDLEAALRGHCPEIMQLSLRVLIESRHPHIERGALQARLLFLGVLDPYLAT